MLNTCSRLEAATTHRFEARYFDSLVGPLPAAESVYRDRSPLTHAANVRTPMLILQGGDDPVVPKSQADNLVAALRRSGTEVEYRVYEGEGHGFSRPETIVDELDSTEVFLARHVLSGASGREYRR